jgi:hypothetical protein
LLIAERADQPDKIRVRFAAVQRPLLLEELESFRGSVEEALTMVADKPSVNPAYLQQKRREQFNVELLLAAVQAVHEDEDFEVMGDATVLVACIQGGAGVACERLMNYTDDLRPGPRADEARQDLHAQLQNATIWVISLLASQEYEPERGMPPVMLEEDETRTDSDAPDAA